MKKEYTTPQLFVHGSVETITLRSNAGGNGPKGCAGNDGRGSGQGVGAPCTS
jgi:hypothetical protein